MTKIQKAALRRIVLSVCTEAADELVPYSGPVCGGHLIEIPPRLSISRVHLEWLAMMAGFGNLSEAFNEAGLPSPPGG